MSLNLRDKYIPKYFYICNRKWPESICDLQYKYYNLTCCASDTIKCKNKERKVK